MPWRADKAKVNHSPHRCQISHLLAKSGPYRCLIQECNRDLNMTVVMVTHEPAKAERYAERRIYLGDGKVLGEDGALLTAAAEERA